MASDTSNPFARYRDGNPPTPGVFATAESVYASGTPARIGDLIVNAGIGAERGLVVGVFGSFIAYLIDEADPQCEHSQVGGLAVCGLDDATVVGHAYNPLREVARIERLADADD